MFLYQSKSLTFINNLADQIKRFGVNDLSVVKLTGFNSMAFINVDQTQIKASKV